MEGVDDSFLLFIHTPCCRLFVKFPTVGMCRLYFSFFFSCGYGIRDGCLLFSFLFFLFSFPGGKLVQNHIQAFIIDMFLILQVLIPY